MTNDEALKCVEFENVALAPPENKLTQPAVGGLAFPEKYPDFARHYRAGDPSDVACEDFPADAKTLAGQYIWGGFALHHFGHFIAESLGRLWVIDQKEYTGLPVLFLISRENQYIRPYIEEVMQAFDIDDYIIETECVFVEKLVIGQLGKYMGGPSHPDYVAWLKQRHGDKYQDTTSPKKLCIFRGHFDAGNLVGEKALEEALAQFGYVAFKPEQHSIEQQLKYYSNAEKIIFSEGSAIHMCDLLAELQADVVVLKRRPVSVLAETSLQQKVKKLYILGDVARVISPRSETGIGFNRALSYIAFEEVQACLDRNGFTEKTGWPKGWSDLVALTDAVTFNSFLKGIEKDDVEISLETADMVVKTLMQEIVIHFKLLRGERYRFQMARCSEALVIGDYELAISHAKKALRQFSYSQEAALLLKKAERGRHLTASFPGRLLDSVRRVGRLIAQGYKMETIELPNLDDV